MIFHFASTLATQNEIKKVQNEINIILFQMRCITAVLNKQQSQDISQQGLNKRCE